MVYSGITATEAEIDQMAGENVSASYTDIMKTQALLMAESELNWETQYDFTAAFGTLDVKTKYQITKINAAAVAIEAIRFDMAAIGHKEASTRINILNDIVARGLKRLAEDDKRKAVVGFTT